MSDWTTNLVEWAARATGPIATTSTWAEWLARGVGALAGSSVSLVYFLPKERHEAVSRLIVGVITGLVFGASAGEKLVQIMALDVHPAAFEVVLMGAAATSFVSWWALGMLVRLLEQKSAAPDKKNAKFSQEIEPAKDKSQ